MSTRTAPREAPPPPVLKVTRYDQVSSLLMAFVAGLVLAVAFLSIAWYASRAPAEIEAVPVELVEIAGGAEDGAIEESLRIDSPAEQRPDATPAEVVSEEREVEQSLETVLELADEAVAQTQEQLEEGTQNTGTPASAEGTGRRGLGSGPGQGGFPREQRWYIRYGDQQSVEEYARQLDFFGIVFGAIVDGKLAYVSNLSSSRPEVRRVESGAGEKRLYMTWQGGGRRKADLELFKKAGIDVGSGVIFHFYPKDAEDTLARLELAYRKRKVTDIRRTYFSVVPAGSGYEFTVVRQTYVR